MSAASDALREFHEAFGVTGGRGVATLKARAAIQEEEHVELDLAIAAFLNGIAYGSKAAVQSARLAHVAEELADVVIVAYGTADLLGIDLDKAFELKMAANCAKLPDCEVCIGRGKYAVNDGCDGTLTIVCRSCRGTGKGKPIKNDQGKILKPEGWQKPSMAEAIK